MPSGIELSLSSLLPTVSPLPDELINLATSLLAQSRSKATTLKPEEEIGRIYACCHIACQRLGHRLALEIARPTPPVKPKVYTKLHTYLNSVLKTTTTPKSTARARAAARTPTPAGPSTPSTRSNVVVATSTRTAAEPSPLASRSKDPASNVPTASTRKRKAQTQDAMITDSMPVTDTNESVEGDDAEDEEVVDDEQRLLASVSRPSKTPLRRKEKHGSNDDGDLGAAGLLPGLGTMFQPAVDWLSDDRREEYVKWKKAIMREAALVEQKG